MGVLFPEALELGWVDGLAEERLELGGVGGGAVVLADIVGVGAQDGAAGASLAAAAPLHVAGAEHEQGLGVVVDGADVGHEPGVAGDVGGGAGAEHLETGQDGSVGVGRQEGRELRGVGGEQAAGGFEEGVEGLLDVVGPSDLHLVLDFLEGFFDVGVGLERVFEDDFDPIFFLQSLGGAGAFAGDGGDAAFELGDAVEHGFHVGFRGELRGGGAAAAGEGGAGGFDFVVEGGPAGVGGVTFLPEASELGLERGEVALGDGELVVLL